MFTATRPTNSTPSQAVSKFYAIKPALPDYQNLHRDRRPAGPIHAECPWTESRPTSPERSLVPRLSLAQVRDPKSHYKDLRPALIDTTGSAFGEQLANFQEKTRPEVLVASRLAGDTVTCVHGRHLDGTPYKLKQSTLGAQIAPYLSHREKFCQGGAYSFIPIMVNNDRPIVPEFAKFFPPVEPWHDYFLGSEPDAFPVDLLGATKGQGTAGLPGTRNGPKINTSLILGLGIGMGQEFHWHGANVFVQVHGEKKWSLFPNSELYAYFEPGRLYERRKPCPFDPHHADLFKSIQWTGPAHMPRPAELVTRPGDALYLPTGTWHATWNLTDYTFGYTKVLDS